MKYEMRPVIKESELHKEIHLQYGIDFYDICDVLFGYKVYPLNEIDLAEPDEVNDGTSWEDEEEIDWRNLIIAHLRDIFPDNRFIIIENDCGGIIYDLRR